MMPAGGHIIDCADALRERIEAMLTDAYPYYSAMRLPVESETEPLRPEVTVPKIIDGWPDLDERQPPMLPFMCVRTTTTAKDKTANQPTRTGTMLIYIACHIPKSADYKYAWNISELITRELSLKPYLRDGLYSIDADGIVTDEESKLAETWQAYILTMTVPVILPAFVQTEDMHGNPIRWEDTYPE